MKARAATRSSGRSMRSSRSGGTRMRARTGSGSVRRNSFGHGGGLRNKAAKAVGAGGKVVKNGLNRVLGGENGAGPLAQQARTRGNACPPGMNPGQAPQGPGNDFAPVNGGAPQAQNPLDCPPGFGQNPAPVNGNAPAQRQAPVNGIDCPPGADFNPNPVSSGACDFPSGGETFGGEGGGFLDGITNLIGAIGDMIGSGQAGEAPPEEGTADPLTALAQILGFEDPTALAHALTADPQGVKEAVAQKLVSEGKTDALAQALPMVDAAAQQLAGVR